MDCSAQTDNTAVLQRGQQHCRLYVMALFPVSLVWTGTYLPYWYAVIKLQVNCKFFAVHLVAQEKRFSISHSEKIFYFLRSRAIRLLIADSGTPVAQEISLPEKPCILITNIFNVSLSVFFNTSHNCSLSIASSRVSTVCTHSSCSPCGSNGIG